MFVYSWLTELIQAVGILALAGLAYWAWRTARNDLRTNKDQLKTLEETSERQKLSALMNEITGDEASFDRGFVRRLVNIDAEESEIQKHVEKGRCLVREIRYADIMKEKPNLDRKELEFALIGIAVERTIVRYDRVALYVLTNKNELRFSPPDWVLLDVNMIWPRLHKWIQFRRETQDAEYRNPEYARDLERLFYHPRTEKLRQ